MAIYSVVASSQPELVKTAIKAKFLPHDYLEVSNGFWFVHTGTPTPREFCAEIAPNNDKGTLIVMPVSGYYGFHNQNIWDWLKSKGL